MSTTYRAPDAGQPGAPFRAWMLDHGIDPDITTEVTIDGGTLRAVQLGLDADGKVQLDDDQFILLKTVEAPIKRAAPAYNEPSKLTCQNLGCRREYQPKTSDAVCDDAYCSTECEDIAEGMTL